MAEWSGAQGRGRAGGRQRRGSESPDRRLQPAVGPRRASAPVSGSGGAGLSSFRPYRGSTGLAAGGRAGLEGAAGCALFTRCSDSRAGRAGAALHRAPRAASRSACVPGQGRASPDARTSFGVQASLCCSFTHVCNLDSHCLGRVGLGDNDTRFVFVSGSARANAFSFFSGTLVSFSGIAPMAFM